MRAGNGGLPPTIPLYEWGSTQHSSLRLHHGVIISVLPYLFKGEWRNGLCVRIDLSGGVED